MKLSKRYHYEFETACRVVLSIILKSYQYTCATFTRMQSNTHDKQSPSTSIRGIKMYRPIRISRNTLIRPTMLSRRRSHQQSIGITISINLSLDLKRSSSAYWTVSPTHGSLRYQSIKKNRRIDPLIVMSLVSRHDSSTKSREARNLTCIIWIRRS